MKIWVILAAIGTALAQTPAPASAPKGVIGAVTAVDATGKQLTIKADSGSSYTVKLDDKTTFVRVPPGEKDLKKATPIALSDVGVGDRVLARGSVSEEDKTVPAKTVIVMTKADLAKRHDEEHAEWQKGVVGMVTAIDPATKQITVTPRGANPKPVTVDVSGDAGFLRYAPGSYRFDEAKPSTFAEVKVGDNLRARGEKTEDGAKLKAQQILSGSFQTLAGTVISVDAANNMVRVTDLATKKPIDVIVGEATLVRRIPEMMAAMMARRMNPGAAGMGPGAGPGGGSGRPPGGMPGGQPGEAGTRRPPNTAPGAAGSTTITSPDGGPAFPAGPGGGAVGLGGGPGGPGGGRGSFDLQSMLQKLPPALISTLKPGDALIVTSTKETNQSKLMAITLVSGVEPFLASAPRTAGQVNLGAWNFDGGIPAQ